MPRAFITELVALARLRKTNLIKNQQTLYNKYNIFDSKNNLGLCISLAVIKYA